jgi:hypothetical protein
MKAPSVQVLQVARDGQPIFYREITFQANIGSNLSTKKLHERFLISSFLLAEPDYSISILARVRGEVLGGGECTGSTRAAQISLILHIQLRLRRHAKAAEVAP